MAENIRLHPKAIEHFGFSLEELISAVKKSKALPEQLNPMQLHQDVMLVSWQQMTNRMNRTEPSQIKLCDLVVEVSQILTGNMQTLRVKQ
jgi:hypothetical protein